MSTDLPAHCQNEGGERVVLQLLINEACNNRCMFCAAGCGTGTFVEELAIRRFIDEAFTYPDTQHDRRVVFTGGEPGLNPNLVQIIRYVKERYEPVEIGLITNARPFHSMELAEAVAHAGTGWTLASIYGVSVEKHDYVTQCRGSFRQTVTGIQNLLAVGLHVEARAVLHRLMLPQLRQWVDMVIDTFPDIWRMSVVTLDYDGRVPEYFDELAVPLQEVGETLRDVIPYAASKGWGLRIVCYPLCYLPKEFWDLVIPAESVPRHFFSWEKSTHENSKKNFVFRSECKRCLMQGVCPGVASTYLRYFPDMPVWPITNPELVFENNTMIGFVDGNAVMTNNRTGNWMFFEDSSIINRLADKRLCCLPFRTRRELVRQELARVVGTGAMKPVYAEREAKRSMPKSPFDWNFFIYNLTNRCNFRCNYCYTDKASLEEIPIETILDRINQFAVGDFCIEIHGNGEPLVRFQELQRAIPVFRQKLFQQRRSVLFLLVTNGSLIDESVAQFLQREEFSVIVSLDGPPHIQNRHRVKAGGQGTYEDVMRGINALRHYDVSISINSVVCPTATEDIISVFEHHLANGLYRMKFIPVVPSGDFIDCVDLEVFDKALREIADRVIAWNAHPNNPRIEVLNLSYAVLAILGVPNRYLCMDMPCGAGTKSLTINPNGDIYPCHKMASCAEFRTGNVLKAECREQIEKNLTMTKFLAGKNQIIGECATCVFSGLCGGICYADHYLARNSGRDQIARNFDCVYGLVWHLVELANSDPLALETLMMEPRRGDFI